MATFEAKGQQAVESAVEGKTTGKDHRASITANLNDRIGPQQTT